jgi:microcystin-dependent protein
MTYVSGRTPILALPYATPDDDVNVAMEEQQMMEAVENLLMTRLFIVGEMRTFAFTTPPHPFWMRCDGTIKEQSAYPELWAAIGPTWNTGGESPTQFRIPATPGRALVGAGAGPSLTERLVATRWGVEAVVLTMAQLQHSHAVSDHLHSVGSLYTGNHNHGAITGVGAGAETAVQSLAGGPLYITRGLSAGGYHQHGINTDGNIGVYGNTGAADRTLWANGARADQSGVGGPVGHDNTQPSIAVPVFIYAGRA